ncbi:MAG: hypothetical protein GY820_44440, partial [Gammaproteobacteria bacterium]|nr:hypothetical protein [Gammaproteobacteria bacterium]
EEIDLSGQDQYAHTESQDEHYIEPKYNGGYMIYPNDGLPDQVQNFAENLPVQNQSEGNVQIFSQTTSRDNLGGDGSVKEMMGKMMNLMSEKMDHKFAELDNKISSQGFRLSHDAGNVPNKQSTNLQTKSGMMHTVHSTSVGMHGSSCECPECQRQSAQQIRQPNQNFPFDASNNNTPNNGAIQQPNLSE